MKRRTLITRAAALAVAADAVVAAEPPELGILELRQYTLYGGKREVLVSLFEQNFIAPQNALGAWILGTFWDLDDPDRFVWLRGFENMAVRGSSLAAFYTHDPAWLAHRAAANATMVDSDNVLLLRGCGPGNPLGPQRARPAQPGIMRADIRQLRDVDPSAFASFFESAIAPRIADCGGVILARYVSETSANNFPLLPIREREPVFVWFSRFDDVTAEQEFSARLAAVSGWRDGAPEAVLPALMRKPERLRLRPTEHSPWQ